MSFGPDLSLSSNGTFWRFGTYYIPLTYVGVGAATAAQMGSSTNSGYTETSLRLQMEAALRGQLPIRFDDFAIIPYVELVGGLELGTSSLVGTGSISYSALEGGVQAGFGAEPHLYVGGISRPASRSLADAFPFPNVAQALALQTLMLRALAVLAGTVFLLAPLGLLSSRAFSSLRPRGQRGSKSKQKGSRCDPNSHGILLECVLYGRTWSWFNSILSAGPPLSAPRVRRGASCLAPG